MASEKQQDRRGKTAAEAAEGVAVIKVRVLALADVSDEDEEEIGSADDAKGAEGSSKSAATAVRIAEAAFEASLEALVESSNAWSRSSRSFSSDAPRTMWRISWRGESAPLTRPLVAEASDKGCHGAFWEVAFASNADGAVVGSSMLSHPPPLDIGDDGKESESPPRPEREARELTQEAGTPFSSFPSTSCLSSS